MFGPALLAEPGSQNIPHRNIDHHPDQSSESSLQSTAGATVHLVPGGSPFWLISTRNQNAEYELFVESRESIKKDALLSARVRTNWLALDAGYRWIPGPRGGFLRDPDSYSAFGDARGAGRAIPDGRLFPSVFGRIPFAFWLPGVFAARDAGQTDTGLFFASDWLLLAIARRNAALTLSGVLPFTQTRMRGYLDVRRSREARAITPAHTNDFTRREIYTAHAGYGRLIADGDPETLIAVIEAERRIAWDYEDFKQAVAAPERSGRSGLIATTLRLDDWFEPTLAGQDRELDRFRVAGLAGVPRIATLFPESAWPGRFLIRARYYERRRYGPPETTQTATEATLATAVNPAHARDPRLHRFTAGAVGYLLDLDRGGIGLIGESREHGGRTIELRVRLGPGRPAAEFTPDDDSTNARAREHTAEKNEAHVPWSFSAALIYGRLTAAPGEFLFLQAPTEGGAGVRFLGEESAALILRIKSEFFYLYLESRLRYSERRVSTFASVQFRVRF